MMSPLLLLACLAQVALVLGDCGKTTFNPFHAGMIVGGVEARPHSLPWQISLRGKYYGYDMGHSCGGSIVSDRYIITAAHCIYDDSNWKPYVVVGSHNKNTKTDKYEKSYNIAQVITHPRWNPKDITMYDIAILKTDKKITFNDGVQPICLPEATREWSDDSEFLVSGWGALKENGNAPSKLQQVIVPKIPLKVCKQASGYYYSVHEKVICAGYTEGGRDSCQGDSGGPLVIEVEDKWTLAGVVSWGIGCARYNKPGVYTHVAKYRSWIDQYV